MEVVMCRENGNATRRSNARSFLSLKLRSLRPRAVMEQGEGESVASTPCVAETDGSYVIKEGDSVIFCINDEKYTFAEIKSDAYDAPP